MIQSTAAHRGRLPFDGVVIEHYRALADRLRHAQCATGMQTVGLTSCVPRAGVSTVCANLAITAAAMLDRPVLIVDANFVRPSLRRAFQLRPGPGLADVLLHSATLNETICALPEVNLSLVCAGTAVACTRASFDPTQFATTLAAMKEEFGLILVDLPAATPTSIGWNFYGALDSVLLVVQADRVDTAAAQQVKRRLTDVGATSLGVIFNQQRRGLTDWFARR